jgi:hypothetical protein
MARRSRAATRSGILKHSLEQTSARQLTTPTVLEGLGSELSPGLQEFLSKIEGREFAWQYLDKFFVRKYLDKVNEPALAAMAAAGHSLDEPLEPCILEIFRKSLPADSKAGLAATILWCTTTLRRDLEARLVTPWRGVAEAMRLSELVRAFELEWEMAPIIYPGQTQLHGRSSGGKAKAEAERPEKAKTWARWQSAADEIWRKLPDFSASHVAEKIAPKFSSKANTIRQKIKRPDGLLTTPSA